MEYRSLGTSELIVSQVCLGTMTFGAQTSQTDAHKQLDLATEMGVNFIDTAELYPAPASAETWTSSERYIGNWLQHKVREKLILATKVVGPAPRKWIGYIRNGPQLTPTQIEEALNDSLRRLRTDYIDLYQIHWPARNTNYFGKPGYVYGADKHDNPIEETLQTLATLVKSGKVRTIGVSNETPWGLHKYLVSISNSDAPDIVSVQNPYSLLNRTFEIGMAEFSHREKIGLLAYSPLASGALTGKYLGNLPPGNARLSLYKNYFYRYTTPAVTEAVSKYLNLAKEHNLDVTTMALAFVHQQPFVSATITGATNLTQLRQNIESVATRLDESVIKAIEKIHLSNPNPCP